VGPNNGGQNYDAEFLGVFVDQASSTTLNIGIATGQRPDNGFSRYGPGDIRISFTDGSGNESVFGIEVGGGPGDSSRVSGAITEGDVGTTYDIRDSGYTESPLPAHPEAQKAGTVWLTDPNDDWFMDPVGAPSPTQVDFGQFTGESLEGTADYIYNFSSALGQHAFIELSVDWSVFDSRTDDMTTMCVQWGPACGNDRLWVCMDAPPRVIPEPASVVVWGLLACLAITAGWRRRRQKAA